MWNLKKKVLEDLDIDVIAASDWTEDIIKESPILNKLKNVHKIYFGMNTEKFNKVSYKEARKKLNISDDEVVLFHRAQNEFKGTPYVLEALKNLKTEKKVTILTCEGVGLLDEVKDKFNVRDLGVIKDKEMIVAMNACDIFLMPSLSESFGLMAIEAMSCAKPVVVFDNSALPSVTRAPKCGYLVKDRDSADLEKAIKELIENPKERMRRGKLGKKIVEKDYQEKKYYDSLRKLYKKVYNKKRKTRKEDEIKETENARQYKFYLNDLTVRLFGTSSKISKELMFPVKKEDRILHYKYEYADLALQDLAFHYTDKMIDLLDKYEVKKIRNDVFIKVEKMMYLIGNNPNFIKEKLKRK